MTLPDANTLLHELDERGYARLPGLLSVSECETLISAYSDDHRYRSVISMERYRFGRGEYKYFAYPLPDSVERLRQGLYPSLANVANIWSERLGQNANWPDRLNDLTSACHAAGQTRPTPLILKYQPGDYNCLHQDLYGEIHFPLQVILGLSAPGEDYDGGELVLVEQRPRQQSRPIVIQPALGEGIVIPVKDRPVTSKRGWSRNQMRHGVSAVQRGQRFTLGIIFHDAR
ncbi:MAG: proline hydroxylase [Ponticaulis sp.]|nr:proline hydroxylase [Ponticaulis sp.]